MGFNFKDFKKNGKIKITFDNFMLRAGKYIIDIHSSIHYKKRIPLDNIINATVLTVEPGDYFQVGSTNSTGSFLLLDCKLSN